MDTSNQPLISVITPFYNAAQTLRYALMSLKMQTYRNWECILVDDGSVDDSKSVLEIFDDPRFRYFHLEKNQGRGAARQYGLDNARGDFLCFLDADDWIYPRKLEHQLEVMNANPQISLLSTGLGIENDSNQLVGVRGFTSDQTDLIIYQPMKIPAPPNIPFAPSMIRMEAARRAQFDSGLRRSEDADYLIQILMNEPYGLLPEILYVYKELGKITQSDLISGYQNRILVFRKYLTDYPIGSRKIIIQTIGKILLFRFGFSIGIAENLILRRSRQPIIDEQQTHLNNFENFRKEHK